MFEVTGGEGMRLSRGEASRRVELLLQNSVRTVYGFLRRSPLELGFKKTLKG